LSIARLLDYPSTYLLTFVGSIRYSLRYPGQIISGRTALQAHSELGDPVWCRTTEQPKGEPSPSGRASCPRADGRRLWFLGATANLAVAYQGDAVSSEIGLADSNDLYFC
jgi:hypothetical protein